MKENQKDILLICTAGITTGLLVHKMETVARRQGLDLNVHSAPAVVAKDIISKENIGAILIGPQVKYEVKRLQEYFDYYDIPYRLISENTYKNLDGKKALEEALLLFDL